MTDRNNIGSDFVWQETPHKAYCSECDRLIEKGVKALVSIRKGKVQKRVCSDDCRQTFDYRFWSHRARLRKRGVA